MSHSTGFVYGASGQVYTDLATRAAASLRAVAPDANIDIFTDMPVSEGVFDKVHDLDRSWFRPKLEALRRSRFDRTVYLDADTIALADMSDIFEVLTRFDIAAAHDALRNSPHARRAWRRPLPNAFPAINGGVLGLRKSDATMRFLEEVERIMIDEKLDVDQPVIREMLFDSDLRLAVLPPEYNFLDYRQAEMFRHTHTAPRLIHHFKLQPRHNNKLKSASSVRTLVGPALDDHLQKLLAVDQTLSPEAEGHVRPLADRGFFGALRVASLKLRKMFARLTD